VPETLLGQTVKCPACEQTFTATEELEPAPRPGMDRSQDKEEERREPEREQVPVRDRRRDSRDRDEDEDDRDRDRSRRRDRDDEEEDEDDRRSRRRRRRGEAQGKAQAVAVMTLAGGIVAILAAITGLAFSLGACLLWPGVYYSIVCGILCIVKGAQLLGPNARREAPPMVTAILQVVNVINLDLINVTLGIITLVFINDEEVRGYYRG
jgi:hypothetical protein